MSEQKTLWGLWVSDGGQTNKWYLDYFGRPCFSYDGRLVAAHAEARKSSELWVFSVRKVGDDGCPTSGLLEPAMDEVAVDLGAHPGCTEIDELQGHPSPGGIDSTGERAPATEGNDCE